MRIAMITASALLAAAHPPGANAQSVFDGTWKADTSQDQFSGKPDNSLLKGETYECRSCTTPYKVAADGAFHPVSGQAYFDEAAIKVVDPRTVEMRWRKGGKLLLSETERVSADGRTLTHEGEDLSAPSGGPLRHRGTKTRVGATPVGAHAISGEWREQKGATVSDAALTISFKTVGDALNVSFPTGERYTATPGGPEVPVEGDIGGTKVRVANAGTRAMRFTMRRDGQSVGDGVMAIAADGRTATYNWRNLKTGATSRHVLNKQ